MKRYLFAAVASATLATSASAADLPARAAPAPAPVPYVYNWTGPYIGASVGIVTHDSTWNQIDAGGGCITDGCSGSFQLTKHGVIAGGQIGYNWQLGSFVVGLEGDASWTNANYSQEWRPGRHHSALQSTDIDWIATVRARAGIAVDRALFYVTGGVAFADITDSISMTFPTASLVSDELRHGWTAGGGVEYAFAQNWTARAEVLYMDFGRTDNISGEWRGPQLATFADTLVFGRVGVNFKW